MGGKIQQKHTVVGFTDVNCFLGRPDLVNIYLEECLTKVTINQIFEAPYQIFITQKAATFV